MKVFIFIFVWIPALSQINFLVGQDGAIDQYFMKSYEMRERMVADKFRPRYHFIAPEGWWNDVNGAVFWNGRYHIGYLQKISTETANGIFPVGNISQAAICSIGATTKLLLVNRLKV